MKLTSAVIIASTTAQQGARQRENKNPDFGFGGDYGFGDNYDIFSAFNDFNFGSTVAPTVALGTDAPDYGDYNFGLGDAFGDASDSDAAADYMNTVASDYDGADDLGSIRPSDDDEVKSNFVVDNGVGSAETNLFGGENGAGAATNEVQNLATIDTQINNGEDAQRCFVGSSANSNVVTSVKIRESSVVAGWFNSGQWLICEGENDTCEIKVVRGRNDVITQIHSKCANRHSCVDNMRQNFNPEGAGLTPAGNGYIYSTWIHQACRPRWGEGFGSSWNARKSVRDSVCFFCVEPCRNKVVWNGGATSSNDMRQKECVGKSGSYWNAAPIPDSSMKIFDDCSSENQASGAQALTDFGNCDRTVASDFGQTVWDTNAPKKNSDMSGPDMKKLNYYSVLDDIMLYNTEKETNHKMSLMQDVSQIQYAQILARDNQLDFMTDAVDPNSK